MPHADQVFKALQGYLACALLGAWVRFAHTPRTQANGQWRGVDFFLYQVRSWVLRGNQLELD